MEELKARNIIENLERIAAEKGADALTGEIIEECCRTNGADPEDFKNFICENIDLQKIKELQGSEELLPEKLGQVAGGARPVKQGMASFLAATSLLGSAANFTVSADNDVPVGSKQGIARQFDPKIAVKKRGKNKQKQSAWTGWNTLKYIGLGSFVTCASAVAYWVYSQKNSNASQRESSKEEICSPVERNGEFDASNKAKYAQFSKLLDEFEAIYSYYFCDKINRCGFSKTAFAINSFTNQQGGRMVKTNDFRFLDTYEIKAEIGEKNIAKLKKKLECAHNYYLSRLNSRRRSSSSSSSSSSTSSLLNDRERVSGQGNSSDSPSASTSEVGYSEYDYYPVCVSSNHPLYIYGQSGKQEIPFNESGNKKQLVQNVGIGMARLRSMPDVPKDSIQRLNAGSFFQEQGKVDPRFYNMIKSSDVKDWVYKLPDGHCTVYDYGEGGSIKVTKDTCECSPAELWLCEMFSLPALFAVNAVLRQQRRSGLNPEATAVQNAGNAVSPGGSILAGDGSQEESLMMDTDAYLFLNSTEAHEKYYLKNYEAMQGKLKQKKETDKFLTACAVKAWNETGIFRRGIYCKQVGLIGAEYGETINMITTAAADYNFKHNGRRKGTTETYMGPIGGDTGDDNTLYGEQLVEYWNTILKIAHENKNENIILTIGGGGAFKGKVDKIVTALRTVLQEYGYDKNTPWKKCFKNIIIASDSQKAKEKFYDDERYYGSRCLIKVSRDKKGITYEEKRFDYASKETLKETKTETTILNTWTFAGTSTGSNS